MLPVVRTFGATLAVDWRSAGLVWGLMLGGELAVRQAPEDLARKLMLIITIIAALETVTDLSLRPHLERYADLMDLAQLFIGEPDDTLADQEHARGCLFEDWAFIHRQPSG